MSFRYVYDIGKFVIVIAILHSLFGLLNYLWGMWPRHHITINHNIHSISQMTSLEELVLYNNFFLFIIIIIII